jgi:hypothetical protein
MLGGFSRSRQRGVEGLGWCLPEQGIAWSSVEFAGGSGGGSCAATPWLLLREKGVGAVRRVVQDVTQTNRRASGMHDKGAVRVDRGSRAFVGVVVDRGAGVDRDRVGRRVPSPSASSSSWPWLLKSWWSRSQSQASLYVGSSSEWLSGTSRSRHNSETGIMRRPAIRTAFRSPRFTRLSTGPSQIPNRSAVSFRDHRRACLRPMLRMTSGCSRSVADGHLEGGALWLRELVAWPLAAEGLG